MDVPLVCRLDYISPFSPDSFLVCSTIKDGITSEFIWRKTFKKLLQVVKNNYSRYFENHPNPYITQSQNSDIKQLYSNWCKEVYDFLDRPVSLICAVHLRYEMAKVGVFNRTVSANTTFLKLKTFFSEVTKTDDIFSSCTNPNKVMNFVSTYLELPVSKLNIISANFIDNGQIPNTPIKTTKAKTGTKRKAETQLQKETFHQGDQPLSN